MKSMQLPQPGVSLFSRPPPPLRPGSRHPIRPEDTEGRGSTGRWYASYWNAYLFRLIFAGLGGCPPRPDGSATVDTGRILLEMTGTWNITDKQIICINNPD